MREEEKIDPGRIMLANEYPPALGPGQYNISVRQELSWDGKLQEGKVRSEKLSFTCEAGGFTLDQEEIYSVYPPKDSFGLFENVIPHLVLKKRTLPWERPSPVNGASWMALLLFSETEPAELINQDVTKIFKVDDQTYCPVKMPKPGYGEGTGCLALDVDAELFCQLCPLAAELPLLAHARCVSRENKTADQNFVEDWLSVLVGNRLPRSGYGESGLKNTVYLISLEDFGDFLTKDSLRQEIASMERYKKVRIPALASWSFYSKKEEYSFITCFNHLTADSLLMRDAGLRKDAVSEQTGILPEVSALLQRGYVALNHELRDGGRTVSFYHGPFRPCKVKLKKEEYQIFSDARLIYEPELGMFDLSLSMAFNLGRTLGLKDQVFARALLRYRSLNQVQAEENFHRTRVLQAKYEVRPGVMKGNKNQSTGSFLDQQVGNFLKALQEPGNLENIRPVEDETVVEKKGLGQVPLLSAKREMFNGSNYFAFLRDNSQEIPKEITEYLARLSLFYDVPFSYLVPDERMLPENSIRFFRLDHEWMFALLDGAMSLGRSFDTDYAQDTVMIERLLNKIYDNRCAIRPVFQRRNPAQIREHVKKGMRAMEEEFTNTGFLLRSDLVSGFRGLEFLAYVEEGATDPLPCLRLEAIGKDILLGIFIGECNYLEIRQPPEGMHFGVKPGESGYRKKLRSLEDGALFGEKGPEVDVGMRSGELGVLDFCKTAQEIGKALGIEKMSSVHISLEMIQNPATGIVKNIQNN